jgi:hypothetical protein
MDEIVEAINQETVQAAEILANEQQFLPGTGISPEPSCTKRDMLRRAASRAGSAEALGGLTFDRGGPRQSCIVVF